MDPVVGALLAAFFTPLGIYLAARATRSTSRDSNDNTRQARLDTENARQFTALREWADDLQARFETLEARFDIQGAKLHESEDRVYALERDVHAGQLREREMGTTIALLQARLERVQNDQRS